MNSEGQDPDLRGHSQPQNPYLPWGWELLRTGFVPAFPHSNNPQYPTLCSGLTPPAPAQPGDQHLRRLQGAKNRSRPPTSWAGLRDHGRVCVCVCVVGVL